MGSRSNKSGPDNATTRVGRNKVAFARHGRDSMGLKMKMKDRVKLLRSGRDDIKAGKSESKETTKRYKRHKKEDKENG